MNIITFVILTLSPLLVSAGGTISNCCDLRLPDTLPCASGVYKMSTYLGTFTTTEIYCDMTTNDGGWILVQRNRINSQLFDKSWTEYKDGFGDLNKDFWAGLELMHHLTQTGQWEMRVDYQKNDKTWSYLHYNNFSVGSGSEEYPLTVGGFTGESDDWFSFHPLNGMKFSTPNNDNDNWSRGSCASLYKSGWWFNSCGRIDLNRQPPHVNSGVQFTEMKIRPKDCIYHSFKLTLH